MRWLAMVAILGAGCLQQLVPEHKESKAQAPTPDLAEAPSTIMPVEDMAQTQATGDAGGLPFGASCTVGTECASLLCQQTNNGLHCTVVCTMLGAADPACPNNGQCNQKGFCK